MRRRKKMLITLAAMLAVFAALSSYLLRNTPVSPALAYGVIALAELVLFVLIVRDARGMAG